MKLWNEYFEILMDFEGRYWENDPDDPGNKGDGKTPGNVGTKFGVDARSHPGVDIKNLTLALAEKVYFDEFLSSFSSELPEPLSCVVYDLRVNAGEGAAKKAIQRALGMGVIDGQIGPITREAIRNRLTQGQESLILGYTGRRIDFYERLAGQRPIMRKYLKGWRRRALRLQSWAVGKL